MTSQPRQGQYFVMFFVLKSMDIKEKRLKTDIICERRLN
jgi:hypothetical protein